jgi:hypothetical protein
MTQPAVRPFLIAEASVEGCNALVVEGHRRGGRPCRLPPKAIGERGRVLCAWHLRRERRHLDWIEDRAVVEGMGRRLEAELERRLPGVSVSAWVPNDPPAPDHDHPILGASVTLEMGFDQARALLRQLRSERPRGRPATRINLDSREET